MIGLTTYLERAQTGVWDLPAAFLPHAYFDAVVRAGGIAVLLPPQAVDDRVADRVLDTLDGLIVTGGKDVDPARYGAPAHPETDEPRRDRDAWEDALLRRAIDRELPFLGICRGAQVLNVALGGSLHQHLPELVGDRRYQLGGGAYSSAAVAVTPDTLLADVLEATPSLDVPVYHHQAIDRVADGLVVTATTADGVIEAVELPTVPFGIAVQWHPEVDSNDLRLFAALVDEAARYSAEHTARHSSRTRHPEPAR
ncbi:gamma-glutamyl-gamma-aminobutyrate hydrolase family protein [Herbiconiux daphne]|uniref:Gamma-glutamyl-gamma-aminobutyrate hydrolase family protein n=1 Tax=Herbiconiux daphne TaxID=2970914 RepID=A0ABT2H0V5_9MICO|nr:gamma-glutamyl-gamma-aminobutyrate hydrolase family protein [Herbiconiux daphne]